MAEEHRRRPHALLLPLRGQGHMAPMMNVAFRLANHGVTITLASFRKDISGIRSKYAKELHGLDFHLVELDFDPEESSSEVTLFGVMEGFRRGCLAYMEELEADKQAGNNIPSCIIADFFYTWTEDVAMRLGMKCYVFFPSSATVPRLYQVVPELLETGKLQWREKNKNVKAFDGVLDIPGVGALKYSELPLFVREITGRVLAMNPGNRSILVNTFYDLDSKAIDMYNEHFSSSESGAPKLYPIGPVITMPTDTDLAFNGTKDTEGADCMSWLDGQPAASVIYICLGSMARLFPPQIKQLAQALEATENCRFLWVLHKGKGNFESLEEVLPPGFEEKVKGRGMVTTGWVPQLQILAHSAILGFLSHCGWGSTMESLTSAVPMIAWPQGADQYLNCRTVVDEVKVAVEVVRDAEGIVQQKEFERAFGILLGEESKEMKMRSQELKAKGEAAIAPGGSSERALVQLVEEIKSYSS
ncbi:hypothetical protein R1flu_002750 [Riccia fluitans]|uniref:Glycosyltransferase n=1 Tax=Riccia fluitans TaxID=41844 RepID=A0ABD1Y719_9MARC